MAAVVLRFDVYPPDDPAGKISGDGVAARLAIFRLDTNLVDGEYTAELFGPGSGWLEVHVDEPDAEFLTSRAYILVRKVDENGDSLDIGGFFLDHGTVRILGAGEQKSRIIRWEGAGGASGLDRYVLGHHVYATGQTQRGDRTIPGKWAWNDEPYGAMLLRVLEEGTDHPAQFYEFYDWDFTRSEDSNGNDWEVLADYETDIGTSGLKLWADFLRLGLVAEVLPDLTITAYRDLDEYRTDRTSATFAAGKVRFEVGENIVADAIKQLNASSQRTHVLLQDRIGDYQTVDENIQNDPIAGVPYMAFLKSSTTADDDAIIRMGKIHLTYRDQFVNVAKVRHLFGPGGTDGAEGYDPAPAPSGGDYWLGDLVTIHTGTTELDYNEATIEVAAIRFYVQDATWMVETELGAQYRSWQQQSFQGQIAQTIINQVQNALLCEADTVIDEGRVNLLRLYFSNDAAAHQPSVDAAWEVDGASGHHKALYKTADGTLSGSHQVTDSNTGQAGGKDICNWQGVYGPLTTAEAAAIAVGGLTLRAQVRGRMRYGAGISEAAQDGISQIGVRVTTGASTTIRGTAKALHTLASSAGSAKWPAQSLKLNRQMPPAAATNTLSAVGGTAAGDFLVVELGIRNYTTVTSGSAMALTSDSASDLPEDDASSSAFNSWVDLFTAGSSSVVVGDGMEALVGTSLKAKRCDDTEHYHAIGSAAPTADDDRDAGFRRGTIWINDDGAAFFAASVEPGEADWISFGGLTGTPGGELGGTWAAPTVDPVHVDASHYQLNKLNGTTAPTVNDDSGDGYSVGSRWIDTTNDRVYTCTDATGGAAVWKEGFSVAGGAASISGGTETTVSGYHYCAFTSSGTLTVTAPGMVDVLVVGGGGGGGAYFSGGGGGAGDVVLATLFVSANQTIVVGAGGAGGTATTSGGTATEKLGKSGEPSKFGTRLFAAGGGLGLTDQSGLIGSLAAGSVMHSGASAGGGGGRQATAGGFVIGGGNAGGASRTGNTGGTGAGGGGGGAGAAGATPGASDTGAAGGNGVTISEFSAFGASGVFGGGGGGGGVTAGGAGGTGGGGHGGGTSANTGLTAGTANTGGGGGGGGNTSTTGAVGSAGGSGVVLVRAAV